MSLNGAAIIEYESPATACPDGRFNRPARTLHVTERRGHLSYELLSDGLFFIYGDVKLPPSPKKLLDDIAALLKTFASVRAKDAIQRQARESAFAAECGKLFNHLVPEQLAELMRGWDDGFCVTIVANDDWIPWELLHDGKGFLWQRFLLCRLPKLRPRSSRVSVEVLLRPKVRGPQLQVIHVIGTELGDDREEQLPRFFDNLIARTERTYRFVPLVGLYGNQVLENLATADLIHFDCHGHSGQIPRLKTAGKDNEYEQLTLSMIEGEKCILRLGSFVFVNACSSDTPDLTMGPVRSFGRAFFTKGAVAFIGPLGKVPVREALDFANQFYQALAGPANGDVAAAFEVARGHHDLPVALIYCFYANPLTFPRFALRSETPVASAEKHLHEGSHLCQ